MTDLEKEKENIIHALVVRLKMLENGHVSAENMAKLILNYFISLQKPM